eukprot:403350816
MKSMINQNYGAAVLKSLAFNDIAYYLHPNQLIQLQILCKFAYEIVLPRSLHQIQIAYRKISVLNAFAKDLIIFNPCTNSLQQKQVKTDFKKSFAENVIKGSIMYTQTPTGHIYLVVATEDIFQKQKTQILYLNQKDMTLQTLFESKRHFFLRGAVCSTKNSIFVSGSLSGNKKSCAEFSLKDMHQLRDDNLCGEKDPRVAWSLNGKLQ